jgi:cysteine-rich repeat protein
LTAIAAIALAPMLGCGGGGAPINSSPDLAVAPDLAIAASCGNGVLDPGEQCDDGNRLNLDGCDSHCNYEAVARMTTVSIMGTAAPAFCSPTTNALGTQAITMLALGQLNTPLQNDAAAGTINVLVQLLGLDDLTGASGQFSMGVLAGTLDPAKGAWPGNNPIDWWLLADHTTVSNGLPTGQLMNGVIASHSLTAGPSDVSVTLLLGGSPAVLRLRDAHLAANVDAAPAPNVPAPPPAHLAPGLTVFQSITASGANQGLCGNITVASLAQIPVPQVLTTGASACSACAGSNQYVYCGMGKPVGPNCNSLLDVLVGGCKVLNCLVPAINAAQPDVPATTGGTVTPLAVGAGAKVPANLTANDDDAYSAYLTFNANRAHFTGQDCAVATDCQSGQACTSGKCQ